MAFQCCTCSSEQRERPEIVRSSGAQGPRQSVTSNGSSPGRTSTHLDPKPAGRNIGLGAGSAFARTVSQESSNSAEPSVAQDGGTGGTAQPSEAMDSNFGSSGSLGEGSDIPSASSKTSNPQDGVNQLMPFKRQKTRDNGTWGLQRRKTQAMEDYLNRSQSLEEVPADNAKGPKPVTPDNIAVLWGGDPATQYWDYASAEMMIDKSSSALTEKGSAKKIQQAFGNIGGLVLVGRSRETVSGICVCSVARTGSGVKRLLAKVGVILSFDTTKMTAQVLWEGSGKAHSHYQPLARILEAALSPELRYGKSKELVLYVGSNSTLATAPLGRRNSQAFFADKAQTLLIFDWDDTLFPTTYVRDDLDLSWNKPLKDQSLTWAEKAEVGKKLDQCAAHVVELLKSACSFGKVVLVTLARAPWVSESCKNFYVSVGRLINQLKVPIVYAQEGIQVDYNKSQMTSDEEIERFWSAVKGKAIARECRQFYSQYEGQSWKNVISIGDSDFERLGTQSAMEDYMKERGIEQDGQLVDVGGHMYKVRTKTFKMVDEPTIEELTVEVEMLKAWLPLMVKLDSSFDVNLNNADDPEVLQSIEKTLRGETAH
ncbi:unnamed protein product [Symbiodinium sp. CCMP2456]|nr:unnamed protein product [Symbiodinium sp. CCMP2456]